MFTKRRIKQSWRYLLILGIASIIFWHLYGVSRPRVDEHRDSLVQSVPEKDIDSEIAEQARQGNTSICPPISPYLRGSVKGIQTNILGWPSLESHFPNVNHGGWKPSECLARQKVVIILPYRNRENHLRQFLLNMHSFLQRQQLDYQILVIEQADSKPFNRGMLFNVGFLEAINLSNASSCFVMHDIDLIPENDYNIYACGDDPRHLSVAVNTMKYKLPYKAIFGGAIAVTHQQFLKLRGFSNRYFGWGGEDDDLSNRLKWSGMRIARYPTKIARYTMLKHKGAKPNDGRYQLIGVGRRMWDYDGVSNSSYRVISQEKAKLYIKYKVELDYPIAIPCLNLSNTNRKVETSKIAVHKAASWDTLNREIFVMQAGEWKPPCDTGERTAIVLAVKDIKKSDQTLRIFMRHLIPILIDQELFFRIYLVIAQNNNQPIGKLFNVGFQEATTVFNATCVIFHDIRIVSTSSSVNYYKCGKHPYHLSPAIDRYNYTLPYDTFFGGAIAVTPTAFLQVQGFQHKDLPLDVIFSDLYRRFLVSGIQIERGRGRYAFISQEAFQKPETVDETKLGDLDKAKKVKTQMVTFFLFLKLTVKT